MPTFQCFLNIVSSLKIKLLEQKALLNFEFMWNEPMLALKAFSFNSIMALELCFS